MTLTELQYIVVVAQERHFGRAAERVFVTQPVLSLAIKKLEEELGTTIIERRQGQIALTTLGEQLVHQAHVCWRKRSSSKSLPPKVKISSRDGYGSA